jgi:hypothetical protein
MYSRNQTADILYGCETWSLTLRQERRLGVFENSVRRKIFGRNGGGGDYSIPQWDGLANTIL